MRKLLFLFFLLPAASLFAQKTFHAGLLAGFNGSQVHGDSYSGFDKAGLVAGGFVCTNPEAKAYFEMELQYSMKGSKKTAHPDKNDFDVFELRMNYVEVPLLLRVNLHRFYFEIGETFGVLTKVREWDDFGEIQPEGFRRWETALVTGVGYTFSKHWYVDFRYTNSLVPVKKFATPLYYQNYFSNLFNKGMYHNVLGLSLCYRFGKNTNE